MSNQNKKMNLITELTASIIGLIVGVLLMCVDARAIFWLFSVLAGVIGVVISFPAFLAALADREKPGGAANLIVSGLVLLVSVVLMISHNFVVMILVGLGLILAPVMRISRADDTGAQLRAELPRLIVGLMLVAVGPCQVIDWLFHAAGILVIVLSLLDALYTVLVYSKKYDKAESVTKGSRVFVDETGDGVADKIYVDTTGDGKADTEMRYGKRK